MKYYTKDWYIKMQIYGWLTFPETEDEWIEEIEFYKREGIDIQKNYKDECNLMRDDLLRFLPIFFEEYIKNGDLKSKYPSQNLKNQINIWLNKFEKEDILQEKKYFAEYISIKDKLPKDIVKICEHSLHDSKIEAIEKINYNSLAITLDTNGTFDYTGKIKLIFSGVKYFDVPADLENLFWLKEEVYLTESGFELNILADSPLSYIRITADNMIIKHQN